jgi:hypothetical protein
MTPEQKRMAIAEARGWKYIARSSTIVSWCFKCMAIVGINPKTSFAEQVPDYLNDLDAMHEAEAGLSYDQHRTFRKHLWWETVGRDPRQFVSATAAQRADAFILTLNLTAPCEPS